MRPAVVADAGPLHYLILIGHVGVLQRLYGAVSVPDVVAEELRHVRAPARVREWAMAPPDWLRVRPSVDDAFFLPLRLDAGECAALTLALSMKAGLFLADDRAARDAARARGLGVVGTIGILDQADRGGLLDLPSAVAALRATNFRCHPSLLDAVLDESAARCAGHVPTTR